MTYTISYSYYKGEFEVTKMYYRKLYTFIKFNKTDIKDIKLFQDYLHKHEVKIQGVADMNGDGIWNIYDLILLKRSIK